MALRHRIAEQDRRALPPASEHDELDPEFEHVDAGAEDASEVEELRAAVRAVVVMHGNFDNAEPGVLDLAHQLEADHAAVAIELHPIEDFTPHQPEVAVDVADAQREEQLHRVVVDAADDDAVQRIRSTDLVAGDHVGVVAEPLPERCDLRGIVLGIAIGVGDQILGRGREPGTQRAAVAPVTDVMDDPDVGDKCARALLQSVRSDRGCRR